MSNLKVKAQVDTTTVHEINGKKYFIHTVEKGNTLYTISKIYQTPVDVIKRENPSVADGLSIGERIFILKKKKQFAIVDGNFITHEVEKGRTLYSLSKEYGVKQKDILTLNPELKNGKISEGQLVKIPVKELKSEKITEAVSSNPHLIHKVLKGETLYSLSKLYEVSVDSILLVNNGLPQGLRLGEQIYIPKKVEDNEKSPVVEADQFSVLTSNSVMDTLKMETFLKDSLGFKGVFKIALLLPFYIDENDEMVENLNALEKKKIYPKSKYAVEFYQGFLLALEKLTTDSLKFQLEVIDTKGNDTTAISSLIANNKLKDINLIVGPLYPVNFSLMANYAKVNGIPIVSPVKIPNRLLLGNDMIYKVVPSASTSVNNIANFAVDSFPNAKIIAVEHVHSKEKTLTDTFIKKYNEAILNKPDSQLVSQIKKISIEKPAELVKHVDANAHNIFYIPSNNSSFVTNLFITLANTIYSKNYENCKVTLIGTEKWDKFQNIDLEYFDTLDVHIPVHQFTNYEDPVSLSIIEDYIKFTETYPSEHSLLAYDIANYFLRQLTNKELEPYFPVSQPINFVKTGVESGFENTQNYIVRYSNNSVIRVY